LDLVSWALISGTVFRASASRSAGVSGIARFYDLERLAPCGHTGS
jgi:hypothetical protein